MLDTNCWVYALDDPDSGRARWLTAHVLRPAADRGVTVVTPSICLAELLVLPHRSGRARAAAVRRAVESLPGSRIVALDEEVAASAAELRAATSLRLPDAVVVATAQLVGARLLSNDGIVVTAAGPDGLLLDELVAAGAPPR